MAADVYAVVTQLGLRRPAIVGCSMGGIIALQYALGYPADLSRLAVLASFASPPAEMAASVERQRADIKAKSLREIAEDRVGAAFTASADQSVRAWMVDMIADSEKEGDESEAETTFAFDAGDRLKEIAVPTTIIHGGNDATVPVARAHAMAAGIPGRPCTSCPARATSPTCRSRKRSTRSWPADSESPRTSSRSGKRTDGSPA